jgi:hypothetical protein
MSKDFDGLVNSIVVEAKSCRDSKKIINEAQILRKIRTCVEQWIGAQASSIAWDLAVEECAARHEVDERVSAPLLILAELSVYARNPGSVHILLLASLIAAYVSQVSILIGFGLAERIVRCCVRA